MKPERVDLDGVTEVNELIDRIVRMRVREAHGLAGALGSRDMQSLHDFRIACKRLRYALERFGSIAPDLAQAAVRLACLQDALGEAHDRDVLLTIVPPAMLQTERQLRNEREGYVDQAAALWRELEQLMQALDSHPI